ncbi:MAG: hypothetical protein ACR2LQ_03165 [Acidimicrobiales bacterium]
MAHKVEPIIAPKGPVRTDDWPTQATDSIVKVVGTAHQKITGPITTVARALAYGLLAAALGATALVVAIILAGRLLDAYLPAAVFGDEHMWAAHLIVGLLFTLGGIVCFRRAHQRPRPEPA